MFSCILNYYYFFKFEITSKNLSISFFVLYKYKLTLTELAYQDFVKNGCAQCFPDLTAIPLSASNSATSSE